MCTVYKLKNIKLSYTETRQLLPMNYSIILWISGNTYIWTDDVRPMDDANDSMKRIITYLWE